MVQQTQFRTQCSRPSLEYSVVDLVQNIVQQTQFRIQCSRPSLEYGVVDLVKNIVQQTLFRIWFCRPSLEYFGTDPVQNKVQQTQFKLQCIRPSKEYSVADLAQNMVFQTQLRRFCRPSLEYLYVRIVGIFFENCTDCRDFFFKMQGFFKNVTIFSKKNVRILRFLFSKIVQIVRIFSGTILQVSIYTYLFMSLFSQLLKIYTPAIWIIQPFCSRRIPL